EELAAPRNFALELLATAGPGLLVAVLAAMATFCFRVMRPRPVEGAGRSPAGEAPVVRWEFYFGGMLGLTFGSVPRLASAGSGALVAEGVSAAARSVVWFAAFAVYERS